jgi:hypothetical protein
MAAPFSQANVVRLADGELVATWALGKQPHSSHPGLFTSVRYRLGYV